jgi:hypothetical protein
MEEHRRERKKKRKITVVKPRRFQLAGHVDQKKEVRNAKFWKAATWKNVMVLRQYSNRTPRS